MAPSDPKIPSLLSEAISREFITRTRYQPVPSADAADAVLSGAVLQIERLPTVYDQMTTDPKTGQTIGTGRASVIKVSVSLQVLLTERATGKVLFRQDHLEFTEAYQLASSSADYFDESSVALERVARDAARSVVSRILEQF